MTRRVGDLINSVYLEKETQERLEEHFQSDPVFHSTSMRQFFSQSGLEVILDEVIGTDFHEDNNEIIYRRKIAKISSSLQDLIESDQFQNIFTAITGSELNILDRSKFMYKFGHKDYTIIHDEAVLPEGYDIIIDLTPEWDDALGGYVAYNDGEGQYYTIPSDFGSVSIVERKDNFHYFVKYVNHYAENLNRYLLILNSKAER